MKKTFGVLAVLFLLAAVALGIFLATFDADRYRPMAVKKLEAALGRPVKLERISLRWKGGIAAELKGLAVLLDQDSGSPPLFEIGSVNALLRLGPLLRGDVQIGSLVLIAPRASLIRHPDGGIEVPGLFPLPASAPAAAASSPSKTEKAVPLLIRELEIQEGVLSIIDQTFRPPLEITLDGIRLKAALDLRGQRLEIREASAQMGRGTVSLNGSVRRFNSQPEGDLRLKLENVRLETLVPSPAEGQAALQGGLTITMDVKLQGLPAEEILKGFSASGQAHLADGKLSNVNLLREAFDRLTVLPGLTETLESRLPPSYAQKLTENDTLLRPVDLSFTLENGVVTFPGFRVATDAFELAGSGRYGLDGSLNFPAQILIGPELSDALVKSVEELRFLADDQRRIVLPVRVEGTAQKPSVSPDVQAVASKLFSNSAQDLLGGLLNKVLEKNKKEKGS